MSNNYGNQVFVVSAVVTVVLLGGTTRVATVSAHPPSDGSYAGHAHDGQQGHDHEVHDDAGGVPLGPHGGQLSASAGSYFEVFYAPHETRLYVLDGRGQPASARGVRGQVIMRMRANGKEYPFPLHYMQGRGEDYLAAGVDVSRIRDGNMDVRFELAGLPDRERRIAEFTQTFALSRRSLTVTVAPLTEADEASIARQKFCPVMTTPLGDHGTPIKLMVGNQPLFVCCKGCISKVQNDPELYLRKVAETAAEDQAASGRPEIVVAYATSTDQAAVQAQGQCVVMEQRLGGHGKPIKITIDGQPVFVCCKGCIRKVQQNPDLYLAKARELRGDR